MTGRPVARRFAALEKGPHRLSRPVRPRLEGGEPRVRIGELLAERAPAYARFEQVSTDGRWFSEIVADLLERLENSERD